MSVLRIRIHALKTVFVSTHLGLLTVNVGWATLAHYALTQTSAASLCTIAQILPFVLMPLGRSAATAPPPDSLAQARFVTMQTNVRVIRIAAAPLVQSRVLTVSVRTRALVMVDGAVPTAAQIQTSVPPQYIIA